MLISFATFDVKILKREGINEQFLQKAKNDKKSAKNGLTKSGESGKIDRLSGDRTKEYRKTDELEKTSKKLKKLLKKVLTREKGCGIILKLSRKKGSERSLKIEQQEISTKQM